MLFSISGHVAVIFSNWSDVYVELIIGINCSVQRPVNTVTSIVLEVDEPNEVACYRILEMDDY